MDENSLKELAGQYGCPQGEKGIKVSRVMHASNLLMIQHSIRSLELTDGDRVLEVGYGACGHLRFLFEQADSISYAGLEISDVMVDEARKTQSEYPDKELAFELYDGINIPYENHAFDKIFTVNTLYFWKQPQEMLNEICRVLKPGGRFSLTFFDREFLQNLPFSRYGFRHYEPEEIQSWIRGNALELYSIEDGRDIVAYKDGMRIIRNFFTYIFCRKENV